MKYIGQYFVICLEHTNMPNVHLLTLEGNTTVEIVVKISCLFIFGNY